MDALVGCLALTLGQVHPTTFQWDLSPLIAPAKISVKGCDVLLRFLLNSNRVNLYALYHYLA